MISHVGVASCMDEGPGHVLRTTEDCVVEAALFFLEGNGHDWDPLFHYAQDYYPLEP